MLAFPAKNIDILLWRIKINNYFAPIYFIFKALDFNGLLRDIFPGLIMIEDYAEIMNS